MKMSNHYKPVSLEDKKRVQMMYLMEANLNAQEYQNTGNGRRKYKKAALKAAQKAEEIGREIELEEQKLKEASND